MTVVERRAAGAGTVHGLARGPVAVVAVLTTVAHLAAAWLTPDLWLDEAYVRAIGRSHLAWGSADQPPLVPAAAWLVDTLVPGSLLALRVPAILVTTAAVVVATLIAQELGGDRRAQVLTAVAQATGLFAAVSGHWLTPYAFEPLEWLVAFWLLVRWMRVRDDRLLLALGVVLGIALMTKFQIAAVCVVVLAGVAVLGPRELLGRPALWFGGVVALLIASPTLVWQALHGWPQLGMTSVVAREVELVYGGRGALAWELVVFGGLLAAGLALAGLWWLVRDAAWREYRFLGAGFVALYVLFLVTEGRPYYLLGYVGVMAAVGAVGFGSRRRMRVWPAWVAGIGAAVVAVAGLVVSPAFAPSARPAGLTDTVATAVRSAPPHTALVAQDYVSAAYLDVTPGLPPVHSTNRGYGYFAPPADTDVDALYVGTEPGELVPYFRTVTREGGQGAATTWLLTGRTESWSAFWPGLRHLALL